MLNSRLVSDIHLIDLGAGSEKPWRNPNGELKSPTSTPVNDSRAEELSYPFTPIAPSSIFLLP